MAMIFLDTDVHAAGLNIAQGPSFRRHTFGRGPRKAGNGRSAISSEPRKNANYIRRRAHTPIDELSKAVQAAGTDESVAAIRKMKETPIDDMFAKGTIRKTDGLCSTISRSGEVTGAVQGAMGLLQCAQHHRRQYRRPVPLSPNARSPNSPSFELRTAQIIRMIFFGRCASIPT